MGLGLKVLGLGFRVRVWGGACNIEFGTLRGNTDHYSRPSVGVGEAGLRLLSGNRD